MHNTLKKVARAGTAITAVGLSVSVLSATAAWSLNQFNRPAIALNGISNAKITGTTPSNTVFNVQLPQTRQTADGVLVAGSTTITSATANFTSEDVGHGINAFVNNAAFGGVVNDPIVSITNSTTAVLRTAPTAASTGVTTVILGAACSGDNSGGFTLATYLIHANVDVTTVSFSGNGPTSFSPSGGGGYSYVDSSTGSPVPAGLPATQSFLVPGSYVQGVSWGTLVSFDAIPAGGSPDALVPTGTSADWKAGIICLKNTAGVNSVADYWTEPITFTLNAADPNGFTWAPTVVPGPQVPEAPLAIALPLGAAGLFAGTVAVNRRRRRTSGDRASVA